MLDCKLIMVSAFIRIVTGRILRQLSDIWTTENRVFGRTHCLINKIFRSKADPWPLVDSFQCNFTVVSLEKFVFLNVRQWFKRVLSRLFQSDAVLILTMLSVLLYPSPSSFYSWHKNIMSLLIRGLALCTESYISKRWLDDTPLNMIVFSCLGKTLLAGATLFRRSSHLWSLFMYNSLGFKVSTRSIPVMFVHGVHKTRTENQNEFQDKIFFVLHYSSAPYIFYCKFLNI